MNGFIKENAISEPLLEDFIYTHRKDLATFAIKSSYQWQEFATCMRKRLDKTSKLSNLLKNLSNKTLSQILPREIRTHIVLSMPPAGYSNASTLRKMRLLFLGDLPPRTPMITFENIPINILALWIDHNRVPLQTLNKPCDDLTDLLHELTCVDLTRFQLDDHYLVLQKIHKVRDLTVQFFSDREFNQIMSLEHLNSLTFRVCGILDTDRHYLKQLTQLTSLSFITCYHITDRALNALRHLTALTHLTIRQCEQLTDAVFEPISTLTHLTALDISYCPNFTNEGLSRLTELPLRILDITYCHKITNTGLDSFKLEHLKSTYCHLLKDPKKTV